jgi:hypothetical protein
MSTAIICAWAGGICLGIAAMNIVTPECPYPAPAPAPVPAASMLVSNQPVQTPLERCLARCTTGVCQRNCVFKHK